MKQFTKNKNNTSKKNQECQRKVSRLLFGWLDYTSHTKNTDSHIGIPKMIYKDRVQVIKKCLSISMININTSNFASITPKANTANAYLSDYYGRHISIQQL